MRKILYPNDNSLNVLSVSTFVIFLQLWIHDTKFTEKGNYDTKSFFTEFETCNEQFSDEPGLGLTDSIFQGTVVIN